ncbi:MAG: rod shape-determining protein RodA [Pseudomonadota bacterium]|nr:rod shape-determining protein RodA [Pseudomonadota bacterium]
MTYGFSSGQSLADRVHMLNLGLILLVTLISLVGVAMLYSAGGGSWTPWAGPQLVRFGVSLGLMLVIALTDLRFWFRQAYVIYGAVLVLLVVVEIMGHIGMGAQRWINLGFFVLQPSELMKLALVLALARYFHTRSLEQIRSLPGLLVPAVLVALPVALVLLQPNLGTALLLVLGAAIMAWAAGVQWWIFAGAGVAGAAAVPVAFTFLHEYQKKRVYTFLDPGRDPWGAGYNILQSKIALGSGGLWGRGYMQGTQSQLMFLPEKHTDFIFVVLAEEFGMAGAFCLLALYIAVLCYGFAICLSCRNQFGRLVAMGVTGTLFLYLVVNVAMVSGLIPVVGIPLPLVSYGGTAMMTLMMGIGLLLNVSVNREQRMSRSGKLY